MQPFRVGEWAGGEEKLGPKSSNIAWFMKMFSQVGAIAKLQEERQCAEFHLEANAFNFKEIVSLPK